MELTLVALLMPLRRLRLNPNLIAQIPNTVTICAIKTFKICHLNISRFILLIILLTNNDERESNRTFLNLN